MQKPTTRKYIIQNSIYIGVFLLVFIIGNRVLYYSRYSIEETETIRSIYALGCGCYGVLFGFLNHVLPMRTMEEGWKADRVKLLIWGVPILIIIFCFIAYERLRIFPDLIEIGLAESGVLLIFSFILGYTIVMSLFGKSNGEQDLTREILGVIIFFLIVIAFNKTSSFMSSNLELTYSPAESVLFHFNYLIMNKTACIVYGALIGILHHVIPLNSKDGKWKIDHVKLLIWGIPVFAIVFCDIAYWFWEFIPSTYIFGQWYRNGIILILSFILGNIIVTSFKKIQDYKNEENQKL